MKIIDSFEQGSFEWEMFKIGKLGGTRIASIITPARLQLSKSSDDLVLKMIDENITGLSAEKNYISSDMDRGNEFEPLAREEYEKKTGIKVVQHGFCVSDKNPLHGLSPDGFTENLKGGQEFKCPGYKHLKYISDDYPNITIYNDYKPQILNYFVVNEDLEWIDLVSYRPEFYPMPIHIQRIERVNILVEIEAVQKAIDEFFVAYQSKFEKYTF